VPLKSGNSAETILANYQELRKSGRDRDQAWAIAYEKAGKRRKKGSDKKKVEKTPKKLEKTPSFQELEAETKSIKRQKQKDAIRTVIDWKQSARRNSLFGGHHAVPLNEFGHRPVYPPPTRRK
jgi:hypothetical protein